MPLIPQVEKQLTRQEREREEERRRVLDRERRREEEREVERRESEERRLSEEREEVRRGEEAARRERSLAARPHERSAVAIAEHEVKHTETRWNIMFSVTVFS